MGNTGKWIGGILGWVFGGGPLGALVGVGLGHLFDAGVPGRPKDAGERAQGARNSFLISLLVLSAAIMKADRRVMRSELDYVKDFLRRNFGEEAVREGMAILKELLAQEIRVEEVAGQIAEHMPVSQRLQLFHYLCGISVADGSMVPEELELLRRIALALRLDPADAESILAMFGGTFRGHSASSASSDSLAEAYRVLEIEPSATDDEVKKAYRRMAMKYHPDKVSTLGEDVRRGAEEKFKALSAAYERIRQARGMK